MFFFIQKQQYFYWIPNILYFTNFRKTKYVKALIFSTMISNALSSYGKKGFAYSTAEALDTLSYYAQAFATQHAPFPLMQLPKKRKKREAKIKLWVKFATKVLHLIGLKAKDNLKWLSCKSPNDRANLLISVRTSNWYRGIARRIWKYTALQLKLEKYRISYYYDAMMQYKSLGSIVSSIKLTTKLIRQLDTHFIANTARHSKHYTIDMIKKMDIHNYNPLNFIYYHHHFKLRRLIKSTIKKFKTRSYFKKNARVEKKSDFLKYKLSLFFTTTFSMPLKSARLLYNTYNRSENIVTFSDFFFFLETKLDLFLQKNLLFSTAETNFYLSNHLLYINDVLIKSSDTFIHIGDFIKIKQSNISRLDNIKITLKQWFYILYFFKYSSFMFNAYMSSYIHPLSSYYSSTLWSWFWNFLWNVDLKQFISKDYIYSTNKYSFMSEYLELIKGFTNYYCIISKKSTNFWDSLTWYNNFFLEKWSFSSFFDSTNILHYNKYSKSVINDLTKIYVSLELTLIHKHINLRLYSRNSTSSIFFLLWKKLSGNYVKQLRREFVFKKRYLHIRRFTPLPKPNTIYNLKWWCILKKAKPYVKADRSRRSDNSKTPKKFSYKQVSIAKSVYVCFRALFRLYNKRLSISSLIYSNSLYNSSFSILPSITISNNVFRFFSNTLQLNLFTKKTNSPSYKWYLFTNRLKDKRRIGLSATHYTILFYKNKYKYNYSMFKWLRRIGSSKKVIVDIYSNSDYYQFSDLYFESYATHQIDIYNKNKINVRKDLNYLFYNFYTSLSIPNIGYLLNHKNVLFVYKFPKNTMFYKNLSKWFTVFKLDDLLTKNVSDYI